MPVRVYMSSVRQPAVQQYQDNVLYIVRGIGDDKTYKPNQSVIMFDCGKLIHFKNEQGFNGVAVYTHEGVVERAKQTLRLEKFDGSLTVQNN